MTDPRHCAIYLKRLQLFLDILGNPEKKIPHYIHVTGTSGKGSVTTMLHSILQASGKKVGSTYSPHPSEITERWKIGKRHMSRREFVEIVEYIKPKLDQYIRISPYDMLSFYELTEAIGFVWFARLGVDWAVLEVACGGRYDSSNIIPKKDIAVITNIGLDHVGVIGNNKRDIAYEKAGIIKRGCRAYTSETNKRMLDIIGQEANKKNVHLTKVKTNKYKLLEYNISGIKFQYQNNVYALPVIGEHQIKNAILCIEIAQSLNLPVRTISKGLAAIELPIRMEVVDTNPLTILDGAHNPDKIRSTVDTIMKICDSRHNKLNIVLGFSGDKNIAALSSQIAQLKPKSVACTRNTINPFRKVADPKLIAKKIKKLSSSTKIEIFAEPFAALDWSKKLTNKGEILLVTGSIFLSGELRKRYKN